MEGKKHLIFKEIQYKSQGELRIAKFLTQLNIKFEYEFPIAVKHDNKVSIWYPDFYLKEFQIVVEFFGYKGGSENYDKGIEYKKKVYGECGIECIGMEKLHKFWIQELTNQIIKTIENKKIELNYKFKGIKK